MHEDSKIAVNPNLTPEEMINMLDPLSSPMPMQNLEIPDPSQLSIPSESVIRGNFTDRMMQRQQRGKGSSSSAKIMAAKPTNQRIMKIHSRVIHIRYFGYVVLSIMWLCSVFFCRTSPHSSIEGDICGR